MNWLDHARREIAESARPPTANTAERSLTAVTAVPRPTDGSPLPTSNGSIGSTSIERFLESDTVPDAFEERAAILEFDGGLSRDDAERAAWEHLQGEDTEASASRCNHDIGGPTLLLVRRPAEVLSFCHSGLSFTASVSRFVDTGEVAEVFLEGGKVGSTMWAIAQDLAIVANLALHHGAGVDELRYALTRLDDGSAAGPLGTLLDLVNGHQEG